MKRSVDIPAEDLEEVVPLGFGQAALEVLFLCLP